MAASRPVLANPVLPSSTQADARQALSRWHEVDVAIPLAEPAGSLDGSRHAEALHLTARVADAAPAWARAVAEDPENPALWHNLGVSLFKIGLHAEAARAFSRAVRLAPDAIEHHLALARATPSPKEGHAHALAALALPLSVRERALALRLLAWAQLALELEQQAAATIARAVELVPNDASVRADAATILLRLGHSEDALHQARAACETAPDWPRLWRLRWEALVATTSVALRHEARPADQRDRASAPCNVHDGRTPRLASRSAEPAHAAC